MACIHCILLAALKSNASATFAEGTNCGTSKDLMLHKDQSRGDDIIGQGAITARQPVGSSHCYSSLINGNRWNIFFADLRDVTIEEEMFSMQSLPRYFKLELAAISSSLSLKSRDELLRVGWLVRQLGRIAVWEPRGRGIAAIERHSV
jgi:hypothetical protein